MRSKSMAEFIRENRDGIDACINAVIYRDWHLIGRGRVPTPAPRYNDEERRGWILNDEGLYNWARSEGVEGI